MKTLVTEQGDFFSLATMSVNISTWILLYPKGTLLVIMCVVEISACSVLNNWCFLFLPTASSEFVLCDTMNSFQLLHVQVLQQEQHSFQSVTLYIHTHTGCLKLHKSGNKEAVYLPEFYW